MTAAPRAAPAPYRHTQFGRRTAAVSLAGLVLATVLALSLSPATVAAARWLIVALYAVFAAAFLLFGKLTVEIDAGTLRLRFGIGLIRKAVPVADILRSEVVRTAVWWGFGIHLTPSGWLYNVAGRDAVKVEIRGERAIIVGSDDAPALQAAIDAWREGAGAIVKPG